MRQPVVQIDAFTDRPFAGNPAAVCLLPEPREDDWMQAVAREMNLSETAFLAARADGGWDLRWFTPRVEVDLCGHATLAAAHLLWEDGHLEPGAEARFHTRSGVLRSRREEDGWVGMDFPAKPAAACEAPPELARALGAEPSWVGTSEFDLLALLPSEAVVRGLEPDLRLLRAVHARGVIVTARAEAAAEADFVSRFFAPRVGVEEDPVTGSAHCVLAPFWAERLGRAGLVGFQASERGGTVRVRAAGERVHLAGRAVTVMRGELLC